MKGYKIEIDKMEKRKEGRGKTEDGREAGE
jgi:hypothetical protein